jgi:hypothetical protein
MYAIWMMLEARVRTDEAIEATVCVDARALRRDAKSFSTFSCSCMSISWKSASEYGRLFPFRQYFHTTNVRMAMKATPPITPPAIAPTFGLEGASSTASGLAPQMTWAHASQVWVVCMQTWFEAHTLPSQVSSCLSHWTQRFSRWKTFSMSAMC